MAAMTTGLFSRVLLAAAFSLAAAWYASLVFAPYRPPVEVPHWQQAVRIAASGHKPNAYFRYRLQLAATPRRAVLTLAAPDQFQLYVNGESVAESEFVSVEATGAYDIAPYLLPGENVIAVAVVRETYPGPASLTAEGYLEEADGEKTPLATGTQWRAATTEQWQLEGTVAWYGRGFDDTAWERAVPAESDGRVLAPLDMTPAVLARFDIGDWIWLPDRTARDGTFRRELVLDRTPIESAWLGVSSSAAYSVTINGELFAASSSTSEYLDTYAAAAFLRPGRNLIEISVHSDEPGGRIAIAGLAQAGGQTVSFASGPAWQSTVGEANAHAVWLPPVTLDAVETLRHIIGRENRELIELREPLLRILDTAPPTDSWKSLRALIPWLLTALGLNAIGAFVFVGLGRRFGWPREEAVCAYLLPQTVLLFPLLALMLARFDVRLDGVILIAPFWLVLGAGVLLVWWAAILSEARFRSPNLAGEQP